ncbi:hypothetical protein [Helicobacter burdigaliensis]|uniref:hypothetical protein n=1 Tax=Helicobacter burdigaliensis TaxID=2315334 RepID=UPI000EF6FE94|nr:hypothetical protein [Helicobacter burdigaliensis]
MRFTKFAFKASLYIIGISIALSVMIILGHKAYIAIFAESYPVFENPCGKDWGRDDYALRILNKSYVLDEEVWNKNLYFANEFKEDSKLPKPYDAICAKSKKVWQNQKLEIIENGILIASGIVQDCKIIWKKQ